MVIKNIILFINICISILRLFILQSIQGVQFETITIQIFRERRLSLKNFPKNVELERKQIMINLFYKKKK